MTALVIRKIMYLPKQTGEPVRRSDTHSWRVFVDHPPICLERMYRDFMNQTSADLLSNYCI